MAPPRMTLTTSQTLAAVSQPDRYIRVSRAEGLARQLEAEIVDTPLPPGHRLGTKDELKRRFGVAVATVNETVRMLEVRGLVEARPGPGGGVFVAHLDARVRLSGLVLGFDGAQADYADWFEVRSALEPLIWLGALERRTAGDLRALAKIVGEMVAAAERDEPWEFLQRNFELHRKVAGLSGNAPLRGIYLMLMDSIESHLTQVVEERELRGNARVHRALVAALERRDTGALRRALRRHERDARPRD